MGRSWSLRHRRELTMWVLLCCGVPKKALSLRHILPRVEHRTLVSLPAVTSPEFILMALVSRMWYLELPVLSIHSLRWGCHFRWAFCHSSRSVSCTRACTTCISIHRDWAAAEVLPPPLFFIFNPWSLMSLCQPSTLQQNLYVQGVGTSLWLGAVAKSDLLLDKPLDVLFGLFLPRKDLWCVLLVTCWQLFFFLII